ncbi:bifunctional 4-hydroxy-2-oxoglutarate aldolase/2-dehydro-3-deoxy-phosphogluconate aldolase [Sphingomonas ginkgonis]|uniref:2-dehydro-3-deoxy-phosphogluconate aldolase n=1 Tax=Sphingomonas ginkgonis TaxID=2315330 RepID=A0A3R9YNV6_9SPHN|nr:bifunctional 4-hydroxy-2-oxoglutarate aldolase/2-dehydro-3-deoxy-phosphogluconate aldolase [Sphingomonas ginkgonis]RST32003.1 bifunctional 4-hydroxy-2-oxoglutarate aldolase/2-dehydro-3-deoxy-phosphogluconate aldolase [Sphingomonas ginkgonis]
MTADELMRVSPVIPVLVIGPDADPVMIAEALVEGGIRVLEVTLRTPQALAAISTMRRVSGAIVGAGTVLDPNQLQASRDEGAEFIVSPGLTERLGRAAIDSGLPFLPGVASAGDIMRGLDMGLDRFKFFPAESSGGRSAVKALAAPFGQVRFCPTGGIRPDTAAEWLALDAVSCIGGSWLVQPGDDHATILGRARAAAALR